MKERVLLKFIACMCLVLPFHAQDHYYRNLTTEHGLPSSEVYSLIQDKKGFIWGSTDAGVFRYNGNSFTIYTTKEGAPDNTVFNLFEDRHGRIWMSGFNGKVGYYHQDRINIIACSDSLQKRLYNSRRTIGHIYVDRADTLWISNSHSMYKVAPDRNYQTVQDFTAFNDSVNTLIFSPDTGFLLSAKVYKPHPDKPHIRVKEHYHFFHAQVKLKGYPEFFTIKSSSLEGSQPKHWHYLLRDGRILLSYKQSLYIISPGSVQKKMFPHSIISLYEDSQRRLWIGFSKGGANCYPGGDLDTTPLHTGGKLSVTAFLQDNEKGFWYATLENGLYYTPFLATRTFNNIPGLEEKIIGMANIRDTMIIANKNHQLYMVNPEGTVRHVADFQYSTVSDILKIHDFAGNKYISGFRCGRLSHDYRRIDPFLENGFPLGSRDMENIPGKKEFYICTLTDLYKVRNNSIVEKRPLPSRGRTLAMQGNTLYVGTLNGLYEYHDTLFIPVKCGRTLFYTPITDLLPFDGKLVVCTKGEGLFIRDMRGNWTQITSAMGLASDICLSVCAGIKDELWIATNKGISRLTPQKQKPGFSFITYSMIYGLPSNEVNNIGVRGNELWIGTHKGLALLETNPESYSIPSPPVYISAIRVNDRQATLTQLKRLAYTENNLCFFIEVPSYKEPGKIKFLYRLNPQETFKTSSSPQLELYNLEPGNYNLEVYGLNAAGIKSPTPACLSFSVKRPLWLEAWFITCCVVLLCGFTWLLVKLRLNTIARRKEEKYRVERQLAEYQLTALQAQMNPHFMFNAINSIQHYVLDKKTKTAYDYLTKFSHLMRRVLINSAEKYVSLRQEIETLLLYVEFERVRFESGIELKLDPSAEIDQDSIFIPSMLLQPFVENAIWHGLMPMPATVAPRLLVCVKAGAAPESLLITIEDNGVGREFSRTIKRHGHRPEGLRLAQQRIELLGPGSKLEITDMKTAEGLACGTRVIITLYLKKIHDHFGNY